jgi:hypothetical protein
MGYFYIFLFIYVHIYKYIYLHLLITIVNVFLVWVAIQVWKGQSGWCTSVMLATPEGHTFETILTNIARPCLKNQKQTDRKF